MRRTFLVLLAALAAVPSPASAKCGVSDVPGDATLADDHVLDGAYDVAVPSPSLDLVSGRVATEAREHVFRVGVVDLATAAAEAPAGATYSWQADGATGTVYLAAWRNEAGQGGVELYAGRDVMSATYVASYAAPVLDTATDTVTFRVPAADLARVGLRPGLRVASELRAMRGVAVEAPGKRLAQSVQTDGATDRGRPAWGRC